MSRIVWKCWLIKTTSHCSVDQSHMSSDSSPINNEPISTVSWQVCKVLVCTQPCTASSTFPCTNRSQIAVDKGMHSHTYLTLPSRQHLPVWHIRVKEGGLTLQARCSLLQDNLLFWILLLKRLACCIQLEGLTSNPTCGKVPTVWPAECLRAYLFHYCSSHVPAGAKAFWKNRLTSHAQAQVSQGNLSDCWHQSTLCRLAPPLIRSVLGHTRPAAKLAWCSDC